MNQSPPSDRIPSQEFTIFDDGAVCCSSISMGEVFIQNEVEGPEILFYFLTLLPLHRIRAL
jgi:hypothetical protein